jgi:hypothetical protein
MVRAHKTARITTGGYYPPRSPYEPMELREEGPQEQENASPTLAPALVPPLDVEVIELDDDEEEHAAQGDGQPPLPPEDEPAGDGVSPPPMGWTMKVYHKPGYDTASHH